MAIPGSPSRKAHNAASAHFGSPDVLVITGSFETNGTAEITNVKGEGFDVTRSGVGVFDLTIKAAIGKGLISGVATVQGDTADTLTDLGVELGTYTKATGVLEIFTYDFVATPALTDGNGPRVSFVLFFHNRDSLDVTYTS